MPHYTYEDYLQWEGKWELINGIPYAMSPAHSQYHQEINALLAGAAIQGLKKCAACKVLLPVDWKVKDDTVLQPDLLVVCKPYEDTPYITKAPTVVFEILSPSTAKKDQTLKYEIYEREGVKYYVIVNPVKKVVEIFLLNETEGKYEKVKEMSEEAFDFELEECSFRLDFKEIW